MNYKDHYEYSTSNDPFRNYCLWDYAPVTPAEDKFRAVNLLWQSFDCAGVGRRGYEIVESIRDRIGYFQTVFGVKFLGDRLAWEFYFLRLRPSRATGINHQGIGCDPPMGRL